MPDITKIKIGDERERSYKDFPANREFKKRAEDDNPVLKNAKSTGGIGWTESSEQVLYDSDLLINMPAFDSDAFFGQIDVDNLEVGETYKIVWNDDEYVCNCIDLGHELIYLGNVSIIGVPIVTEYPFVFVVEDGVVGVATMSAGTYSIKLSKNGDTTHKIDGKYLPEGGSGWTEGEATTITWDGNTEGKILAQGGKYDGKFCKISNKTPAISDLVGGVLVVMYDDENTESVELSEEDIFVVSPNVNMAYETFVVALEDGAIYIEDGYTTTFPEAGIYSMTLEIGARVSSLTYGNETVHKIDEKYLPSSGSVSKFYISTRTTGGELVDSALYIDEERQTEATLEDVKGAIGTNIFLYDSYTRDAFIPIECCYTKNYQYGFIIMDANPDDLTQVHTRFFGYVGIH